MFLCASLIAMSCALRAAPAQVFPINPDWTSTDMQVSTGAALADINRDGLLDLVVSNGNDISRQRVVVYYNFPGTGGGLQRTPGWQSGDIDYHGHLDVADVNGDGWPDVAVANLLVPGGRPSAKLYLNSNGTLSSLPVWTASVSAESFGLAFGDMNGDGRPDLAVASGDAYNNIAKVNAVYLNTAGALAAAPSWQTATTRNFGNCTWLDADGDGRLDLCYCGSNTDTFIYRNLGTTLSTTPNWNTTDSRRQFCLMAAWGDISGDGRRDLVIADNNQINAGSGRFRRYDALVPGYFNPVANWTFFDGYTSAVALGDINDDGALDLCTGQWFGRTRFFLNTGSGLPAAATWSSNSATATTVEKICLGDLRNRVLRTHTSTFPTNTGQTLFFLPHQPIQELVSVSRDGTPLSPAQYTFNLEHGWLSVGVAGVPTSQLRVVYRITHSLDMAVANWDNNRPNQVYYNRLDFCRSDFNLDGGVDGGDIEAFFITWESGEQDADFNQDGGVDGGDIEPFFALWSVGGC